MARTTEFCLNAIFGTPLERIFIIEKTSKCMKEDLEEIQKDRLTRWIIEWESSSIYWLKRLIPELHHWIYRRHGHSDYHLTQFLSGHGAYADYLFKFKLRSNPYCPHCKNNT